MMEIVEVVSEKAKDSRLEAHRLRDLTRDLEMLAEFLGTTEKQEYARGIYHAFPWCPGYRKNRGGAPAGPKKPQGHHES